jgi:trigger factor
VKSAVETLNPTRVRLTVEVPFEELKPSLDGAYRRIGQQVQVPGFRRGKVPARLIDQRFGREVVLNEAVTEAVPHFYGQAVNEHQVKALGQPELDVTGFEDGGQLVFTAEVDVRPEIALPDYDGLEVTVDDATVTENDVDEQLANLRERFAVVTGVDRPAQPGDFVSLELTAARDGEVLDDGTASGLQYEVGSGTMLDGLDEAVTGLTAGESATFHSALVGGEHAGQEVDVTVTVSSVKVKELPSLDDEFAQTASEFDTLEELRADVRTRTERVKRLEQGVSARDKVLEAVLAKVEVPLPEALVAAELGWRRESLAEQLQAAGLSREDYLESQGQQAEEFDRDVEARTRDAIKAQFVLDAIAAKEQLSVSEAELTEHLVRRAQRSGLAPEQFAQQLVQGNQVSAVVGEVVRGKALTHLIRHAKITDASGNPVEALVGEGTTLGTTPGGSEDDAPADVTPSS